MSAENARIGARLRAARKARGLVVADLAERFREVAPERVAARLPKLKDTERTIRGHEAGEHAVGPRYRLLYAAALEVPEAELFGDQPQPSLWRPEGLNGSFTPDDEERMIAAARNPRRQDPAVIDAFATVLAGQRRSEDIIGPAPLIEPVRAQLVIVEDLVTEARGDLREKVVDVGAQWAQYGGWLHAATGDLNSARTLFDRAAEWAIEVPGPTGASMMAAIHSYRGHLAWRRGKIGPMVGQSKAARRVRGAHPAELTFAAIQEARGHAIGGDEDATERALDDVVQLAARADSQRGEAPPWAYFHGEGFYLLGRGVAYRFLAEGSPGYAERAIELLNAGLGGLGAEARRSEWAAWFVYQLANVHAIAGDPDQACQYAREAAAVVKATNAVQMLARLRHLHTKLVQLWPERSDVAELAEALR